MGCSNNCNDITLLTGNDGADGADGANGSDGKYGGHSSIWKFDPAVVPTPAVSYLRFNNATLNLVTQIHINETNKNATDMSAFLTSFNATGSYGYIRIFKEYDDNIFWVGEITNIVDNGTDRTLTVTHTQSNGTLILDDAVVVTFTPKSAAGTTITDFAYAAKDVQTISSVGYALAPGALTFQKLVHTNSTGSTQNYEVTVSFNVGDNTGASIPGIDCWAALIVNGVNVYEIQEKNATIENAVSGQGFTIMHGFLLNNVATNIQLANTQTLELQFKKGGQDTRINAATLYVRQI